MNIVSLLWYWMILRAWKVHSKFAQGKKRQAIIFCLYKYYPLAVVKVWLPLKYPEDHKQCVFYSVKMLSGHCLQSSVVGFHVVLWAICLWKRTVHRYQLHITNRSHVWMSRVLYACSLYTENWPLSYKRELTGVDVAKHLSKNYCMR